MPIDTEASYHAGGMRDAAMAMGKACSAVEQELLRLREAALRLPNQIRRMKAERPDHLLLILTCAAFLMGVSARYWRPSH